MVDRVVDFFTTKICIIIGLLGYASFPRLTLQIQNPIYEMFIGDLMKFIFGLLLFVVSYFLKLWFDKKYK